MRCVIVAIVMLVYLPWGSAQDKAPKPTPKTLDGFWSGTLDTGVAKLRLAVAIAKQSDGWAGTMVSLDQDSEKMPFTKIELNDHAVRLEIKSIGGVFEGKLNDAGTELAGRWKQGGGDLALTLKRTNKLPVIARPQTPKKPYPYDEHEVAYENAAAKVKLAGTLTLPRGKGPFPAVLLLSGSGAQDRDETLFNHRPFLVIADHLTRHGIAVLRVDDRGVGGSTGDTFKATLEDNAQDALLGIAFLKSRKEIDPAKIGLIGHSEGGVLAPFVASRSKDVAFIVLLAGTGVTGEEILYLQGQAILKSMGAGEAVQKRQRESQEMLFSAVKQESDNDKAKKLIHERLAQMKAKMSPIEQALFETQKTAIDAQIGAITTPWFRYFLSHDPRPALRKVQVPVLVLIGEKDVQVPPKENLQGIGQALKEGGNRDYTLKELPGLNHLFQTAKTGSLAEYAQIEETFAPSALTLLGDWVVAHAQPAPPTVDAAPPSPSRWRLFPGPRRWRR